MLDYCSVVWTPYYANDIEALEKVQRRFTSISPLIVIFFTRIGWGIIILLGLPFFTRRTKSDLIMVFKIDHGYVDVGPSASFSFCNDSQLVATNFQSHSRLHSRKF